MVKYNILWRLQMKITKTTILFALTISLIGCSAGRLSKKDKKYYSDKKSKILTEQAVLAFNRGRYKRAIDFYDIIIASKTASKKQKAWALYEIGFCHYYDKNFSEAKTIFQKLIATYTDKEYIAQRLLAAKLIKKIDDRNTLSI